MQSSDDTCRKLQVFKASGSRRFLANCGLLFYNAGSHQGDVPLLGGNFLLLRVVITIVTVVC